jgi:hypothetical protein
MSSLEGVSFRLRATKYASFDSCSSQRRATLGIELLTLRDDSGLSR